MPVHHRPKGRQKGKGKVGVAKTPTKSCVMESGGNIVATVDVKSTDNTVEQQTVKVAAHQKAENIYVKYHAQELGCLFDFNIGTVYR